MTQNCCSRFGLRSATLGAVEFMKTRWRMLLVGLGFGILLATVVLVGHREEPVYQGKPLSYWVTQLGSDEIHGAPKEAVAAIRAIGPKAVPFLMEWMPHRQPLRPAWMIRVWEWCMERLHVSPQQEEKEAPSSHCVEIAWWALGNEGKSAIPALARVINQPPATADDYSAWTHSAKAISYLGPDAIVPMLTAATNMQGKHEVWELLHNFRNLRTNGAPAVPSLLQWANDPDYFVRSGVASALGGIGKRADLAVPVLLAGLHDSNSMVRRDAATALGAFAEDADTVLPALIKVINGNDAQARGGALSGLGRIRDKAEIVVPLLASYLSDRNSVVTRQAAYALRNLGSRAGLLALLRTTNNIPGVSGIADIVDGAAEIISGEEEERRRQSIVAKLAAIYATGSAAEVPDLRIEGKPLSQILGNEAATLRLDQLLALRLVAFDIQESIAMFDVPMSYNAVTNLGTLRLLCDADPGERAGDEAMVQEFVRSTNDHCRLIWNTMYDPPGQHFLQVELVIRRWPDPSRQGNYIEREIPLRGPLLSFLSTNTLQYFLHGDSYFDYGAYFRVKLAQPVGAYALELTTPSGEHIHTISGTTTNGVVNVYWDLLYGGGKRYTNESFNSTWSVTFPNPPKPGTTNSPHATSPP
jgi:hypothetical protein